MRRADAAILASGASRYSRTMDDSSIHDHINSLAEEEERLYTQAGSDGLDQSAERRLHDIQLQLDQSYDLLAQRRARRAAGQDPDEAMPRPPDTVESYEQ